MTEKMSHSPADGPLGRIILITNEFGATTKTNCSLLLAPGQGGDTKRSLSSRAGDSVRLHRPHCGHRRCSMTLSKMLMRVHFTHLFVLCAAEWKHRFGKNKPIIFSVPFFLPKNVEKTNLIRRYWSYTCLKSWKAWMFVVIFLNLTKICVIY